MYLSTLFFPEELDCFVVTFFFFYKRCHNKHSYTLLPLPIQREKFLRNIASSRADTQHFFSNTHAPVGKRKPPFWLEKVWVLLGGWIDPQDAKYVKYHPCREMELLGSRAWGPLALLNSDKFLSKATVLTQASGSWLIFLQTLVNAWYYQSSFFVQLMVQSVISL